MSSNLHFDCISDKAYRPCLGDFINRVIVRLVVSNLAETLPLNLTLLIDKSLSMQGKKMEAAIESSRMLIESLRDDDHLTLISFSTTPELLVANQPMNALGKSAATEALAKIQPRGVTRLDLALEEAFQNVKRGDDSLNMLLLLSDGAPTNTMGYVLADEDLGALRQHIANAKRQHGVITSTIGLGDAADCLAPFLESCAEIGQGVFYHENDPAQLVDRFSEEINRVKATAINDVQVQISNLAGTMRKAASIHPDIRELELDECATGVFLDAGALQKGEEHILLFEVVTSGDGPAVRKKLCDISISYQSNGEAFEHKMNGPIIEFTDVEELLSKPGNPEAEKFKSVYMAYQQTRFATQNIRSGGDAKKTKALLESAAKTTRRLGMAKQTKLLVSMVNDIDAGALLNENQLAELATATRKTKVLSTP